MLLGYGARNCWCFKEWLDIDLRLNGYVPNDVSQGRDYSTVLGFEGANASGKTNALKVFCFIRDFVCNSFSYSVDEKIPFDTFFLNNEESEFYVEFKTSSNAEYRYESSLLTSKVVSEVISLIKDNSAEIVLKRENNEVIVNNIYDLGTKVILKDNASIISTLYQYGINEIKDIYAFFRNVLSNVSYGGFNYSVDSQLEYVSIRYRNDLQALKFSKELIKRFDTGIDDIKIREIEDKDNNKTTYYPMILHSNDEKKIALGFGFESSGTKALYSYLIDYYYTLENGGILVLDEFDINIHKDILPLLLEMFTNTEKNKKGAQLLFTSLNPTVMDVLGRYRTYLFEKVDGESCAYRLDEPKTNILRNDRSISVPYGKHLIGGYPRIETQ